MYSCLDLASTLDVGIRNGKFIEIIETLREQDEDDLDQTLS